MELLDNPAVAPMLDEVLGAEYRLDHVYSTLLRPAANVDDPTLCGTSRWHSVRSRGAGHDIVHPAVAKRPTNLF